MTLIFTISGLCDVIMKKYEKTSNREIVIEPCDMHTKSSQSLTTKITSNDLKRPRKIFQHFHLRLRQNIHHMVWSIRYGPYDTVHMTWSIWYGSYDMEHMIWTIFDIFMVKTNSIYSINFQLSSTQLDVKTTDQSLVMSQSQFRNAYSCKF